MTNIKNTPKYLLKNETLHFTRGKKECYIDSNLLLATKYNFEIQTLRHLFFLTPGLGIKTPVPVSKGFTFSNSSGAYQCLFDHVAYIESPL